MVSGGRFMKIFSPDFRDMQPLTISCGYHFDNISPTLQVSDLPTNTKSLALIVYDPDAPGGSFIHWLAWNIPSDVDSIKSNVLPDGVLQGKNDFGNNRYDGPAPPSGTHRYIFTIYSIDTKLTLSESSTIDEIKEQINNHMISESRIIGLYSKR
jgi:Raf kinase inhibitor-like YbhB/YbcL family protein